MTHPEALLSPFATFVLSPLLLGLINRTKAIFAGRKGQPILQLYFDLFKLMRKGSVYSSSTTLIFRIGPVLIVAVTMVASLLLPIGNFGSIVSFNGDIFLFVYLLAIARFITILSALDTASAFEGMGASREAFFSALAEPVLLIGFVALARDSGVISLAATSTQTPYSLITGLMVGIGLFVVLLAENCRIPFDDPNTHLELTMIHEVMVLDHSGPGFGFIQYGAALKLWLFCTLVSRVLLPIRVTSLWLDWGIMLACIFTVAIMVGIVESTIARVRLLRVPQLLIGAGALMVLGLIFGTGV